MYRNYKERDATSFLKDLDLKEMIKDKMCIKIILACAQPFLEIFESVLHKPVTGNQGLYMIKQLNKDKLGNKYLKWPSRIHFLIIKSKKQIKTGQTKLCHHPPPFKM